MRRFSPRPVSVASSSLPRPSPRGVREPLRWRSCPALEISLLGPPRVRRDGEPVAFDTRKATALLAHLALADRPRSREALCELLWPDQDPEHARGALRRTLSALRKAVGEEWIDTAGDSVALRDGPGLQLDVRRFRALATGDAGELADAVELFRGELLEGFSLRDSPDFDAWYAARGRHAAARARRGARPAGARAGRARRVRPRDPPRAALARARPAARARPPRADPPVRARRRPGGRARAVPRLRADAQPGARRRRRSTRPRRCSSR